MEPLLLSQIIKATGGSLISGSLDTKISGISIDSRTISCGDLFIALKGEKFDGSAFLEEAFKKGAIGAVVAKEVETEKIIIKVKDTLRALGDIAKIYREMFDIPVVAISGSNGKTTTKEMLSHILSKEFNTLKAKASFNNFVGVPLTLLEIKRNTQVVVMEMEINLLGGIKRLCEIAQPLVGIVTNIGNTHLEYLKTKKGVYKEKSELIESLPDKGTAVLNCDDPYVVRMKELTKAKKVVGFGIKNKAEFSASEIEIKDRFLEFTINSPTQKGWRGRKSRLNKYRVRLNTIFYNNVYNALAAIAVAHSVFGLNLEAIAVYLEDFKFPPLRMELIRLKDIEVINDSYNANPQSMREAILTLKNLSTSGRKIAILGDMLELGQNSLDFHYQIGKLCAGSKIDLLITVGNLARYIAKGARDKEMLSKNILSFKSNKEICKSISHILKPADTILIKGSRKMRMEEIANTLCQNKKE